MLHSTTVWLYSSLYTIKFVLVSESDHFLLSSMVVSTVDLLVFKGVNDYKNLSRYLQTLTAFTKQQSTRDRQAQSCQLSLNLTCTKLSSIEKYR